MQTSERSQSIWKATQPTIELQPLDSDRTADVCVVGGGIAGLQVAYELARAGLTVIVLEAGDLGGGETSQTTAHLSSALDDRYFELERLHGREGAHLAYASHDAAIDRIETVAAEEGIACDFQRLDGYLFLAEGDTLETLERELAAAHRAGFRDVERQATLPLPSFAVGPCLRFPRQGQFHPLRYLAGLAEAILRRGGRIHPHTRVTQLTGGANASVETELGHRVRARSLVVATNTPINDRFVIHSKQAPYRTFVIGLRMAAGSIPRALYWDTADPYHYVRLQSFGEAEELLIVGGEDHKTGHHDDADERHRRLEEWTRLRFPAAREVVFRWSGQVMEPFDGMAFIGRNPGDADNVYIATGDSGHGMTHGVIAGLLISALILGREHPWATLYNPARKTPRAAMEYARNNLDVARSLTEWVRGGEVASLAAIAPGTGAVVRQGLRKLAAYRDESGRLTVCSAVCTHLGCIVHWNSAEQSWDCPCHGSRYSPEGEVLTGPATQPLERVEVSLPAEEPKRPPA